MRTLSGAVSGTAVRMARASGRRGRAASATAASRTGSAVPGIGSRMAARASASACLTRGSCSPAKAWSSAGSAAASRERNTAWAASSRRSGSGFIRVRLPTAASTARRMRLLTLIGLSEAATGRAAPAAGRGVEQSAVRRLDVDAALGRLDQQIAGAEGVEDRRRPRAAAGGDAGDSSLDVVELGRARTWPALVERLRRATGRPEARGRTGRHRKRRMLGRYSNGKGGRRRRVGPPPARGSGEGLWRQLPPVPPHLPVLTLKLPQDIGARQSEIRSFEPSR